MMKRRWIVGLTVGLAVISGWTAWAQAPWSVVIANGNKVAEVRLAEFSQTEEGTVAYQGPVFDASDLNWKTASFYRGVPLGLLLERVGGMTPDDVVAVIATDGYTKVLPYAVIYGQTPAGTPILAIEKDDPGWEGDPALIFLAPDGLFSNEDMLVALGEGHAHYYGGETPSTTGLMVSNVAYVVVNHDGGELPTVAAAMGAAEEVGEESSDVLLTVIRGGEERIYTQREIESLDVVTGPGTYTTSTGTQYTATYTGVPFATLIGNVAEDTTVRVTAADGYAMNYRAGQLLDVELGTWILAYEEDGEAMPFDPGYFRVVQVGEDNPHFESALSARMVETIEVLGEYEPYELTVVGQITRVFNRHELEAGIGCPCHTSIVTSTSKDVPAEYSGLPLWRLIAYVDDDLFPAIDEGIFYEDEHFDAERARQGYSVVLVASDGYSQTVSSDLIAGDDRFVVAFKKDGAFLDPATDGYIKFVFDDSVELPDELRLRSVKSLVEILIEE